jgi:hypothetical protein
MANKRTTKKPAGAKNENALAKGDEAARYWEDHVAPLIKGIKVSNLPGMFHVPVNAGRWATRELLWGDHVLNVAEWSGVGKDIAAMMEEDDPAWKLPKNWSYERLASKLAPGEVPHEFDIPNPRHYGLDRVQHLPHNQMKYGAIVQEDFRGRICALWARRMEDRGKGLKAFLSHHLLNGGDEAELVGYVKHTLIASLRERPCLVPAPLQPVTLPQIEVGGLIHELEDWVEETAKELAAKESLKEAARIEKTAEVVQVGAEKADVATVTAPEENPMLVRVPKTVRPVLKLLALVHALRKLTEDKSADITSENADALAKAAGSNGASGGRQLLRWFNAYAKGFNKKNERMHDGKVHTVKDRYRKAIPMLEKYPKAKAMAEQELEEILKKE